MNNETTTNRNMENYQYARPDIVERLEKGIGHGDVMNLIDRCDDLRRTLLMHTEDGTLFDRDLEDYKEFYTFLCVLDEVVRFLSRINKYGPDTPCDEARELLIEKFGKGAEAWLK